jgi:Bacterial regulatory proteins, luxR family
MCGCSPTTARRWPGWSPPRRQKRAAARGVPPGCLAEVLRAFGGQDDLQGAGRGAAVAVPGLVEQLTARELEVLVLLAAGMPNPRIAEQLVVTLDMVKSTSATCWASAVRPTAPRPSPRPASSA